MSYIIKATLSSLEHPDYGVVTIPFPLSRQDYEDEIGRLSELEAGDAVAQDCYVEDIDSFYGVLDCLKGQKVNVDELDYLAKRLDSFDKYETQQFQAACHAFGKTDIRSLINMTFSSQGCTVISDFNKLEEAGKQHYLTIHGGSASTDELERVDGKTLAERLLQSGDGELTPYGLFFRNEMKIECLYEGKRFPDYLWDVRQAEMELLKPDGEPVTVFLPTTKLEFARFCERNGLKAEDLKPEDLSWLGSENDNIEISGGLDEMWEWNDFCKRLEYLSDLGRGTFFAAVEVTGAEELSQMESIMSNIHDFVLRPGVKNAEELGRYMIQKSGQYDFDSALEPFYNYRGFGEFLMLHGLGQMTRQGYLECAETSAFADFFSQDAPEQKQAQEQRSPCLGLGYRPAPMSQGMTMGGM